MGSVVEGLLVCRYPRCGFHSRTMAQYEAHRRSHSTSGLACPRSLQDLISTLKTQSLSISQDYTAYQVLDVQHRESLHMDSPTDLLNQPPRASSMRSTQVFKCDRCSKVFTRAFTLRAHIRTHTGEKPYKCERCPKKFTRDNDRKTHQETHSGQRQFVCSGEFRGTTWGCGRPFSRARNLERHYQQETGIRCTKSSFVAKPRTCQMPNKTGTIIEVQDNEDDDDSYNVDAEHNQNQVQVTVDGQQYQNVLHQYRYLEQHNSDVIESHGLMMHLSPSDRDNAQHILHPAVKTLSAFTRQRYPPERRPKLSYRDRFSDFRCYWCSEQLTSPVAFTDHWC